MGQPDRRVPSVNEACPARPVPEDLRVVKVRWVCMGSRALQVTPVKPELLAMSVLRELKEPKVSRD